MTPSTQDARATGLVELETDQYGETAYDRIKDHAENGTMPPQFRKDLWTLLDLAALALAAFTKDQNDDG